MMWRPTWLFIMLIASLVHLIPCLIKSEDIHFIIDICSYNNKDWCLENLESVFSQQYKNYHVMYTDDCSTDGTAEIVKNFAKSHGVEDKITLIQNSTRRKQVANHFRIAQMSQDNDVIVVLDGDDRFAHMFLLNKLNKIYQDENVWMTYGQFQNWPTNQYGYCSRTPSEVIAKNTYRNFRWKWGHLRTYRTWLAKSVRLQDLIISEIKGEEELAYAPGRFVTQEIIGEMQQYKGLFFPASGDLAFGHPMLELAGIHVKYVPNILYIRNVANSLNAFKTQSSVQQYCARYVRSKERYNKLAQPIKHQERLDALREVDVVIFVKGATHELVQCVQSIQRYCTHYGNIYVVGNDDTFNPEKQGLLATLLPGNIIYIPTSSASLCKVLMASESNHVLIAQGYEQFSSPVDLVSCAQMLERTYAHAFYCETGEDTHIMPHEWTGLSNVWFWQFKLAHAYTPNPLSLVLYQKDLIVNALRNCQTAMLSDIEYHLKNMPIDKNTIGLFVKRT